MKLVCGHNGRTDAQGTAVDPLTVRAACAKKPDLLQFLPGVYGTSSRHLITELHSCRLEPYSQDAPVIITGEFPYEASTKVVSKGLVYEPRAVDSAFFSVKGGEDLAWRDCIFRQTYRPKTWEELDQDMQYVGGYVVGAKNVRFYGGAVEAWVKGDALRMQSCDGVLFSGMDFRICGAGHAVISVKDSDHVIVDGHAGNDATNSWDRFFSITQTRNTRSTRRVLVQGFTLNRVDWDGESDHPYDGINDKQRGGGQAARICGTEVIVRNCTINDTQLGKENVAKGGLHMGLYSGSFRFARTEVYNCVIVGSKKNGLTADINSKSQPSPHPDWTGNNRLTNVVFYNSGGYEVYIGSKVSWKSWTFDACAIAHPTKAETIRLPDTGAVTLERAQQDYPGVFRANCTKDAPVFVDVDALDFRQVNSSPLRGKGVPIAYVSEDTSGTDMVPVTRSHRFCDGWGLRDPDVVVIDDKEYTVLDSEKIGFLRLDRAVPPIAGDTGVWLKGQGKDIGIYSTKVVVEPPPEPVDPCKELKEVVNQQVALLRDIADVLEQAADG
jgi:hypothetical protein